MPMNQPTEMTGTITDLEQLLQSGVFPDMQPLVDKYQRGSQRETSDLLQAFEQSKRDPRNIIDKFAPLVDLIGYLADRTSGSRQRREEAPGVLRGVRGRRQARLTAKEQKARQAFADKLDLFRVTEGMRTRGLEAGLRVGGGKAADVRSGLGTVGAARGRAAGQRAVTAAGERQTAEDKRQARIDSLITRGDAHMDTGGEFHDLPHAVQSAMRGQSGWVEPPDPDQILFETQKFMDEAYGKAEKMFMDAGWKDRIAMAPDEDSRQAEITALHAAIQNYLEMRYPIEGEPDDQRKIITPTSQLDIEEEISRRAWREEQAGGPMFKLNMPWNRRGGRESETQKKGKAFSEMLKMMPQMIGEDPGLLLDVMPLMLMLRGGLPERGQ